MIELAFFRSPQVLSGALVIGAVGGSSGTGPTGLRWGWRGAEAEQVLAACNATIPTSNVFLVPCACPTMQGRSPTAKFADHTIGLTSVKPDRRDTIRMAKSKTKTHFAS